MDGHPRVRRYISTAAQIIVIEKTFIISDIFVTISK